MFLLDTNVVSELRKAHTPRINRGVAQWVEQVDRGSLHLSAIVIQELAVGVQLAERKNPELGAALRRWLETQVLTAFQDRILPVDTAVALIAATHHVPVTRPYRDSQIAATATVHGLTVVTRNTADFVNLNVALLNPWTA